MTVDDIVKLVLALAVAISLLGISIQLMKVLGTFNGMLQDFRLLGHTLSAFGETVIEDYGKLRDKLTVVLEPVSDISDNLLRPVSKLTGTLGAFAHMADKKLRSYQK